MKGVMQLPFINNTLQLNYAMKMNAIQATIAAMHLC